MARASITRQAPRLAARVVGSPAPGGIRIRPTPIRPRRVGRRAIRRVPYPPASCATWNRQQFCCFTESSASNTTPSTWRAVSPGPSSESCAAYGAARKRASRSKPPEMRIRSAHPLSGARSRRGPYPGRPAPNEAVALFVFHGDWLAPRRRLGGRFRWGPIWGWCGAERSL